MMKLPKAMEPRWYTLAFLRDCSTGSEGIREESPPAQ